MGIPLTLDNCKITYKLIEKFIIKFRFFNFPKSLALLLLHLFTGLNNEEFEIFILVDFFGEVKLFKQINHVLKNIYGYLII
jgi:hypothetical protein